MKNTLKNIQSFIPDQASDRDWQTINRLLDRIRLEALPDDPPISWEDTKRMWSSIPPFVKRHTWIIRADSGEDMLAYAYCELLMTEENRHLTSNNIAVLPEMRRKGLGTLLLGELAHTTLVNDRRLMLAEVKDSVPAGQEFAKRVGASIGLAAHVNQLRMNEVDRQLVASWQARAVERASGFELGLWLGPYPKHELPAIAAIKAAMNQAPTGELDIQDIEYTPELLDQIDESLVQRGGDRWTIYARESGTGELAGYTEILWLPAKPGIGLQGDTAVLERYRNRGLGRWLKAAMLNKVLREKPDVKFIRTSNADANAPMLKINQELGFMPYQSTSICQVETSQVVKYLVEKGDSRFL